MRLEETLLGLERKFWTEGPEFYREHLDASCLTAFARQAGVASKEQIAEQVSDPPRWRELQLEAKGLLRPTRNVAILTYEATAKRPDGAPYGALVSSGYVKRAGGWKMAFHQQTPLPDGGAEGERHEPPVEPVETVEP
jgi:hypothetical protein